MLPGGRRRGARRGRLHDGPRRRREPGRYGHRRGRRHLRRDDLRRRHGRRRGRVQQRRSIRSGRSNDGRHRCRKNNARRFRNTGKHRWARRRRPGITGGRVRSVRRTVRSVGRLRRRNRCAKISRRNTRNSRGIRPGCGCGHVRSRGRTRCYGSGGRRTYATVRTRSGLLPEALLCERFSCGATQRRNRVAEPSSCKTHSPLPPEIFSAAAPSETDPLGAVFP